MSIKNLSIELLLLYLSIILITVFILIFSKVGNRGGELIYLKNRAKSSLIIADKKDKNNQDGIGGGLQDHIPMPVVFMDYYVKSGDSIHSISKRLELDEVTIITVNDLEFPYNLSVGTRLSIPTENGIVVGLTKKNDLDKISSKYNYEKDELLIVNSIKDTLPDDKVFVPGIHLDLASKSILLGEMLKPPVRGRFTSYYGYRVDPWTRVGSFHPALDIANRHGTRVYSAGVGQVIFAGWYWPLGNAVQVRHQNGFVTTYGHLDRINVKVNQKVSTGTIVGFMGSTGRSTGSHLHLEVRRNGKLLNPLKVIQF